MDGPCVWCGKNCEDICVHNPAYYDGQDDPRFPDKPLSNEEE